ncbi:uncharacterized protein PV06_00745 [Exophiala oligosperma]|uniref:Uncharacterized protein n=2 Tax=Chaetothyriales TaxID=34395 RepID=A0A0D2B7B1_9EURO|nr:uncharacterized protein PV06_00745 [Exophiala oligosperma]KAJ9618592.1 hypothetical protein H2204_012945 [Knufia peltigerae]KIW48126.1 hypothetical protein PV06_00745 [Exophiala oligosperma]
MPPMRLLSTTTLGQSVRTFASHSARRTTLVGHRLHGPSARILTKTAQPHHHISAASSSFPMVIRDGLSYSALGALTSAGAFLIYCADKDADMMELLATPDALG